MKNVCLMALLGIVLSLNLRAEEPPVPQEEPIELIMLADDANKGRFLSFRDPFGPKALENVKANSVGVEASEADAVLRKQIKIPEGVGLSVNQVDPEGPAGKAGLKVHDVLIKLNNQHLINQQQFETLVRMNKPGENMEIVLIREGVQQTVTVAGVEKEVPPLEALANQTGTVRWHPGAVGMDPEKMARQIMKQIRIKEPNTPAKPIPAPGRVENEKF